MRARKLVQPIQWIVFPLLWLLLPGISSAQPAQTVTPLPSRPRLVRIGYTTYRPPATVLGGETSLESVTEYLKAVSDQSRSHDGSAHPLDFDVHLGNYYQILSWLESKDLAAAVVSPFQAALLKEKGVAIPLVEFAFSDEHPGGHWPIVTSTGTDGKARDKPAEDYETYLGELLADAEDHPDECRREAPWRRYRINAVAHLSTSGFIAPVLYASDWLTERHPAAAVEDRFWDCFFDNVIFTLFHPGTVSGRAGSGHVEIKFSYQDQPPNAAQGSSRFGFRGGAEAPPIPNDVLMVRPELRDLIEPPVLASVRELIVRPPEFYTSVQPYDPSHYQDFENRVAGLLRVPALRPRFAQWYVQGRYDFTIGDIKKFILLDQEISGTDHLSLVLPGGGVKSAYQAEMLDRLYNKGYLTNIRHAGQPQGPLLVKDLVGTSGGAIVGLFTAQKREKGDERSLHKLWDPGPEVFPLFDMLRWISLYTVLLLFFFLFYVARIASLLDLGRAQERISPHRTPFWLSFFLVAILFAGPVLVIAVLRHTDQTEMPWGEGTIHLLTVFAVYVGISCCVADREARHGAPAAKRLLAPSLLALLLAVACLVVSFAFGRPLAASTGLLVLVIAVILLARERKLGLRLTGIGESARALSLLGVVVVVSYVLFYLMSLKGWTTSIELTKAFWLTLLLSAFVASLACLAVAMAGTRSLRQYTRRGILYFATVQKLGRIRAERAQTLSVLFGVGLVWWSYVAAPAIYSGSKAYEAFYRNAEKSSIGPKGKKRVELQTNLIVTATALNDIQDVIPIGASERLPLTAGDVYFCFSGQQIKCPEKEKVQSKRWFEILQPSLSQVADPVFASGSPFPVFPPHPVTWSVPGALPGMSKLVSALLVDGGYAHNVPLQAAALAGARQVLILRSEPFKPAVARRAEMFPSQLARYSEQLLPFMFEQAQEIDRSVARGLVVVSLSPYASTDRKVPLLTDFDPETIQEMLRNADEDFELDRRIGVVESWGLPEVFRQIREGVARDMFERAGQGS